ncbi:hypothetical protein L6164_025417 [Bauhinia variegata]|uniref:Uncharacterized protein n=1 Tax=Bauhinia variegata TaxID=167791 RepID=A0ACB9M0V4_BAUVA|nr:hypothetical protein L6164_025417 [Bauhinia variegata]
MNRARNRELYPYIADVKGAFVQPAFYEEFGLTVVEAITCGLPAFATCHGGPAEIIEDGISGFHIDPHHPDLGLDASMRGTWKIYSERLLPISGVYGFWKHVSKLERRETRRYSEMFYILKFRDLVVDEVKPTDEFDLNAL